MEPSVVVAGESLMDLLVDADGTVTATPGGAPFNVARGLARLGTPCAFLGAISDDAFGERLFAALVGDGVDVSGVARTSLPTTLAVAQLGPGGVSYRFYTLGTAAPSLSRADAAPRVAVVGGLGLALEPMASTLAGWVAGLPAETLVFCDPNVRPAAITDAAMYRERLDGVLARADVVKVSTEDLEALALAPKALGSCVLVTDGAAPARVLAGGTDVSIAAPPVVVRDTVGAGDAFSAGFLAAWCAAGLGRGDLADPARVVAAAEFAVRVAAITCTRAGADPPTRAELGD